MTLVIVGTDGTLRTGLGDTNSAAPPLTWAAGFASIGGVKWLALTAILFLECSCTTLVTRRDLYSPDPDPNSYEYQKRWTSTTTTTTTTTEQELPAGPVVR